MNTQLGQTIAPQHQQQQQPPIPLPNTINSTKAQLSPLFLKTLIECYYLRKEAKDKVSQNRRFYKHLLKVFKWQRRIRKQIKDHEQITNRISTNNNNNVNINNHHIILSNGSNNGSSNSTSSPQSSSTATTSTPSSSSSPNCESMNIDTKISASSVGIDNRTISIKSDNLISETLVQQHNHPHNQNHNNHHQQQQLQLQQEDGQRQHHLDQRFQQQQPITTVSSSSTNLLKKEPVTDLDIVRRNIWLMIVRKDIIQAHRRKVSFMEQKLLKTRTIAFRCQSHFKEFQRLNNKLKQQRLKEDSDDHEERSSNENIVC